ncbi:MAG: hypothetical protein ACHQNA_13165 [Acidimicrobiales bacterium]
MSWWDRLARAKSLIAYQVATRSAVADAGVVDEEAMIQAVTS